MSNINGMSMIYLYMYIYMWVYEKIFKEEVIILIGMERVWEELEGGEGG